MTQSPLVQKRGGRKRGPERKRKAHTHRPRAASLCTRFLFPKGSSPGVAERECCTTYSDESAIFSRGATLPTARPFPRGDGDSGRSNQRFFDATFCPLRKKKKNTASRDVYDSSPLESRNRCATSSCLRHEAANSRARGSTPARFRSVGVRGLGGGVAPISRNKKKQETQLRDIFDIFRILLITN